MGKDNTGKYHPPKGKPSGAGKEEGLGLHPTDPDKLEQYLEMTDKYTTDADELAPHVHMLHMNRNTQKGKGKFKNQQDNDDATTTEEQSVTEERSSVVAEELPGIINKEIFAELANFKSTNCISFFVATHAAGVEVNEQFDPIIFKNKLQEVATRLKEKGLTQPEIEKLVEPGYKLLNDESIWRSLSPGLAVFIGEGFFKYIKLPMTPTEDMVIENSFYVAPLIPLLMSSEYFYLLVISKQCAKLFKADAFGMQRVPVELPQSIEEVKRISGLDATTFRSGSNGSRGPRYSQEGVYHGTGGGNPDGKDNMLVYFEAVDDILWEQVLHNENAPLLLSCVEYEVPIYRKACDYNNVWPEALTGNHEHQDTTTLYQQAKEIMMPYFLQRQTKALENYGNKSATELTSSSAKDVIPATYYSRVSHLFVEKGAHLWGTFDEATSELKLHDEQGDDSKDLIGHAVVKAISTGADVYLLDKEQMPAESPVAAIMRY